MAQQDAFGDNVQKRIEELDWWIWRIEKQRQQKMWPSLYENIKTFVNASFTGDFNMIIEDYDFYFKLKPNLKYELT